MSIRKRSWVSPNGDAKSAWLVDYRDAAGTRRAKQFARKRDAESWLTQAAWEVSRGSHTADSQSVTIKRASELWIEQARRNGLEPTTVAVYSQHARLHINPVIGSVRLNQLKRPAVEEFRDTLLDTKSRAMATRVLRSLAMIVGEAERRGLVSQNVVRGVRIRRSERTKWRAVIPSKVELRAFVEAAARSKKAMSLPFALTTVFTGLRASELRGLAWASVDLRAGTIRVDQRADNRNIIGPPKSAAGRRTIPMAPSLVSALRKWKLRCPPSELNLVFPSGAGTPIFYLNLIGGVIEPLLAAAGLTRPKMRAGKPVLNDEGAAVQEGRYSLHEFRHVAASLWIEQRVSPKRVQAWMGHSSIQVTYDVYGSLFDQAEADASIMEAVEAEVFGASATPMQHGA